MTDISLHECVTADEAVRFIGTIRNERKTALPILNGHAVPHLLPKSGSQINISNAPNSHNFGQFAEVKIGVVTGADYFFLVTEEEKKQFKLRRAWLTPLLPRFQDCKGLAFCKTDWLQARADGKKCWLLSPSLTEKKNSNALRAFFRRFPVKARAKNKTFLKRKLWFAPVMAKKQHAFFRYMGAVGPRIAFSRFNSTCTNIIHRIYFPKAISSLKRKAVVLSLHSSFSQLSAEFEGRAYGSGVLKLEPSETKRIKLLLPTKLKKSTVDKCFAAVDECLREGTVDAATFHVDNWLYKEIPELEALIPRQTLRRFLNVTVQRRLGYPKSFKRAVVSKNDLADFPPHVASNSRSNQYEALKFSAPHFSRPTATSSLKSNC